MKFCVNCDHYLYVGIAGQPERCRRKIKFAAQDIVTGEKYTRFHWDAYRERGETPYDRGVIPALKNDSLCGLDAKFFTPKEDHCEHGKRLHEYCQPCGRIHGGGS